MSSCPQIYWNQDPRLTEGAITKIANLIDKNALFGEKKLFQRHFNKILGIVGSTKQKGIYVFTLFTVWLNI